MAVASTVSRPLRFVLPDLAATTELARKLARRARTGDVIGLGGELGLGKTTFARAFVNEIAAARRAPPEEVPSPTFTLVQAYEFTDVTVFHFDLYRLDRPEDAFELGIEDAFAAGISLIEWPQLLGALLPADRLDIVFRPGPTADARRVEIEGGASWATRLGGLEDHG